MPMNERNLPMNTVSANVDLAMADDGRALPLSEAALLLHPDDDVAVVKRPLAAGARLIADDGVSLRLAATIPAGHKLAVRRVVAGAPVRRYGQIIGFATRDIAPGDHVHTHNLGMGEFERDYAIGADARPVEFVPEAGRRTFMGYARPDGRVGTRNVIAVIASVNCSAHTVREIARHFTPERLAAYPGVEGVIALAHSLGCGSRLGGEGYRLLQRTLAGFADHPNVAGCVFVGLGCETNQIDALLGDTGLDARLPRLTIQESGGVRRTIAAGIAAVEALLPLANAAQRTPQPISGLMLALQCGGSDGWSGVTANPLVGRVADLLIAQGGTAVLAETPEVYGAEHLLTRRAANPEAAHNLLERIAWWRHYTAINDMEIDNNPSPGNKLGGLTTILEKSLGAVAKGGSTPLNATVGYAERVTARGFVMMDTPGYDPVSATGQVAGGCNLVLFTTGRGSAFGFTPAPSIKISTTSALYRSMEDDMDFDAGTLLDGASMEAEAARLLDLVIAVASGARSKSEAQGIGESEFNPWLIGATM
jgi:altronate dehydratase